MLHRIKCDKKIKNVDNSGKTEIGIIVYLTPKSVVWKTQEPF